MSQEVEAIEGTIYYTKRVDGVKTLFKADAALKNEKLIYSHKGKGRDSFGGYNDNIIDFYYDKTSATIYFLAMHEGDWSLYYLKEGEKTPTLLRKEEMMTNTDYIQNEFESRAVSSKNGSLYLTENGEEIILKQFNGVYDEKFTGYSPIGFSPDGNYLIYHSMEHSTPLGAILDGFFTDTFGGTYTMDLSTKESAKFVDAFEIQWIID